MSFRLILIISVCCLFTGIILAAKLPSTFQKCRRYDPDLSDCLQIAVIDAIKQLANGNGELGLPPLEPLTIPKVNFTEGTGPVYIEQELSNIELHGLTNSEITKYHASLDNYFLYTESFSPELRLVADYVATGRILFIPIQGKGKCTITMKNVKTTHSLIGEKLTKKGKDHMKLKEYKIELFPKFVTFNFENLFNGNKQLGDEINKVMNDNWERIFGDLKGGYERSFGLVLKEISNRLFTKVPLNEIFKGR